MTGRGFARRVTSDSLDEFAPLLKKRPAPGEAPSEQSGEDLDEANTTPELDAERAAAEGLFRGEHLRVTNPFHRTRVPRSGPPSAGSGAAPRPPATAASTAAAASPSQGGLTAASPRGPLVWQKSNLPASDVQ